MITHNTEQAVAIGQNIRRQKVQHKLGVEKHPTHKVPNDIMLSIPTMNTEALAIRDEVISINNEAKSNIDSAQDVETIKSELAKL